MKCELFVNDTAISVHASESATNKHNKKGQE